MDIEHDSSYHHKNKYIREVRTWADEIRYEAEQNTRKKDAVEMVKRMEEGNFPADSIKWLLVKTFPKVNVEEIFELAGVRED